MKTIVLVIVGLIVVASACRETAAPAVPLPFRVEVIPSDRLEIQGVTYTYGFPEAMPSHCSCSSPNKESAGLKPGSQWITDVWVRSDRVLPSSNPAKAKPTINASRSSTASAAKDD